MLGPEPQERLEAPAPCGAKAELLEEADAHTVTAKVAQMIFEYIEEGDDTVATAEGARGKEFHEARFLYKQSRASPCFSWLCSAPTPRKATPEAVYQLIDDMATPLFFCKQVVVLCAIYIDRLLEETSAAVLNSCTWRPILVATLLTASKVWEDVHPWNADFEACLREEAGICFQPGALYRLESLFLKIVRWRVFVDGKMYAAYFFSLMSADCTVRARSKRAKSENFDTIIEDEPYLNSDSDFEGLASASGRGPREPAAARGESPARRSSSSQTPRGRDATSPPASPGNKELPWSRGELVLQLRKKMLASGDACTSSELKTKRSLWKLDAKNPHIGALRHAPRALAPSRHLPSSKELCFTNQLACSCACDFGPPAMRSRKEPWSSATTISGATGSQLASELRKFLDARGAPGMPAASATTTASSSPRMPGGSSQEELGSAPAAPAPRAVGAAAGGLSNLDFGFEP